MELYETQEEEREDEQACQLPHIPWKEKKNELPAETLNAAAGRVGTTPGFILSPWSCTPLF